VFAGIKLSAGSNSKSNGDVSADSSDSSLFVLHIAYPFIPWGFRISMFLYNRWKQENF
jgi:hypothetical protein